MMKPIFLIHALVVAGVAPTQANPWYGTWHLRAVGPGMKASTLIYSDGGNGTMRMEATDNKTIIFTRFDNMPVLAADPNNGHLQMMAFTAPSPTSIHWTYSIDGVPVAEAVNTLAADGKSFSGEGWSLPDHKKTQSYVYDRE